LGAVDFRASPSSVKGDLAVVMVVAVATQLGPMVFLLHFLLFPQVLTASVAVEVELFQAILCP
jgi:hypothetical protein